MNSIIGLQASQNSINRGRLHERKEESFTKKNYYAKLLKQNPTNYKLF
jgi:hypothetical protein